MKKKNNIFCTRCGEVCITSLVGAENYNKFRKKPNLFFAFNEKTGERQYVRNIRCPKYAEITCFRLMLEIFTPIKYHGEDHDNYFDTKNILKK